MKRFRQAYTTRFIAALFLLTAAPSAHASTGPKWSDLQLVDFSAAIVSGRVSAVTAAWDPDVETIYTYVTVDVDEVFKGAVEGRQLVLKQAGGIVGNVGLEVSGQARFTVGEDVLVFAEVRPRDLTLYTTALWQGKWTIETDDASGARVAVQRDPAIHRGNDEMARRPFDSLSTEIAARARQDVRAESFATVPDDVPVSSSASPFATLDSPAKWLSVPVGVDIQAGGQPGLSGGGIAQLQNVVAQWNSSGANFGWSPRSTSAPSRCGRVFANSGVLTVTANDPCGEISNTGGVIAVAFSWFTTAVLQTFNGVGFRQLLEVVISSNDSEAAQRFITNPNCYQQVMLHEFGHALGLGHTADASAVMFASVSFSQCSGAALPLQADDIAGIRFIYGGTSTPGVTPPSSKPLNVQVAVSATSSLTASWSAVTADMLETYPSAATSYRLDFRQGHTNGGPVVASFTTPGTSVTVAIPPGTSGQFNLVVTPLNSAGPGPSSDRADFTIGSTGCTGAPAAPTGLSGGVVSGTATVSWNASAGATSYIVQAGSAQGGSELFNANVGSATAVSASGLPPGFRAFVRVIAVNACGQSPASSPDFVVQ